MPRKAKYPEWVMAHVRPGQYVNKVNGRYYLYSAHSERREGVAHPVRVCDGYLGRITQDGGLVPSKKRDGSSGRKKQGAAPESRAYDFGLPYAVDSCASRILDALRQSYRRNGTPIYACSILSFLHGMYSAELYGMSWLSLKYGGMRFPENPGTEYATGIERGTRMIGDVVEKHYGEDWARMRAYLATSVIVMHQGRRICPGLTPTGRALAAKYGLSMDEEAARNADM